MEPEPTPDTKPARTLKPKQPGRFKRAFGIGSGTVAAGRLASPVVLLRRAVRLPWQYWEIFGGIMLLYAVITIILLGGVGAIGGSLTDLKSSLTDTFTGRFSGLSTGFTMFAFLVSSGTGKASGIASAYQTMLLIVITLVLVWSFRQAYAGVSFRIRDAFYNAMAPLMQFIFVVGGLGALTIPAVVGGFLFSALVGGGVLTGLLERVVVGVFCFGIIGLSFYWLLSMFMAIYVVTLPGTEPLAALRGARQVTRGRLLQVLIRMIFLLLLVLVAMTIIMVPVVLFITTFAPFIFFILTIALIVLSHSYLYSLYRELIAVDAAAEAAGLPVPAVRPARFKMPRLSRRAKTLEAAEPAAAEAAAKPSKKPKVKGPGRA